MDCRAFNLLLSLLGLHCTWVAVNASSRYEGLFRQSATYPEFVVVTLAAELKVIAAFVANVAKILAICQRCREEESGNDTHSNDALASETRVDLHGSLTGISKRKIVYV